MEASNEDERWIEFVEGQDEEVLNRHMAALGLDAIVELNSGVRLDIGFRRVGDRTYALSYLYSKADEAICHDHDAQDDYGTCAVQLEDRWYISYRWFPAH